MLIKDILTEDADINRAPKSVQDAAIARNGDVIRYIANPTPDQIIKAIVTDGNAIRWIKDPHKDLQRIAVNRNPYAIKYIKNPDEDIQLAAVKDSWEVIRSIQNPSDDVLIAAFEKDEHSRPLMFLKDKDAEFFDRYKRVFVKRMLELIKKQWLDNVVQIVELLNKKNVDWPELDIIKNAVVSLYKSRHGNW